MTPRCHLVALALVVVACTPNAGKEASAKPDAAPAATPSVVASTPATATTTAATPSASASSSASAEAAKCIPLTWTDELSAAEATFEGKLSVDAQAVNGTGAKERPFILTLDKPTCAVKKQPVTKELHVYASDEKIQAQLKPLVGKRAKVTGKPFASHTAHHHRPIVVDVTKLAAAE